VRSVDAQEDITPARRRRAAVMADVGRLAGVSHQTVSRVINGSSHVRPETREKVLAAMRELDYRPNSVARALVTGRSNTLGVVSFDTTLYGPASTLFGIERAAHEAGYYVIVASLTALDHASVIDGVERLRLHGVDGIVVIAPQEDAGDALLDAPGEIPLVAVEAGPADAVPVVAIDQFAGAAAGTRHLLDLGHETVWHVAGPQDWLEARQRLDGWRVTLAAAGAEVPEPLVGDWSARAGYDLGRRLSTDPGVTAVFVANDQMALGVLRAMHEAGRPIPDRVSVVGFDDVPEAPFFMPPLTTVRQDFNEMGSRGVHLLLRMMEAGRRLPPPSGLEPELIVRASTSVAPR
jgi:DNA-binding LacI/PurR family transcriptional regulator